MQEAAEIGLWKWLIEHVAVPLLSGLWAVLAWWVQLIATRFQKMEDRHAADTMALHQKLSSLDQAHAEMYARRDDVREGFARIDGKLDVLLKHALKDSQG